MIAGDHGVSLPSARVAISKSATTPLAQKALAAVQGVATKAVNAAGSAAITAAVEDAASAIGKHAPDGGGILDGMTKLLTSVFTEVEDVVMKAKDNVEMELGRFEDEVKEGDVAAVGVQLLMWVGKAVGLLDQQETCVGRAQIQDLTLAQCSSAEKQFHKYSAFGQVLISVAVQGLNAVPFGAPVGAIIGVIFQRAKQVRAGMALHS
jgi:hypothetical protein